MLGPGTPVPSSYINTLQFFDKETGVGVTESEISCFRHGSLSGESFPVWLVISKDGGRVWRTTGSLLPAVLKTGFTGAEMAFSSTKRGWLEATGRVGFTSDGGLHWRLLGLDVVTALSAWESGVDVLVNQSETRGSRVFLLSKSGSLLGATPFLPRARRLLVATVEDMAVVPSSGAILVEVPGLPHSAAFSIGHDGKHWVREPEPCLSLGPGEVLAVANVLAAECDLGSAMNSNAKAFFTSSDGGRSWVRRADWPNLEAPNPSGLPTADFFSFGASSSSTFWMATDMSAAVSRDSGRRWLPIDLPPGAGLYFQGSVGAEFFFVDPRRGWLLLPGESTGEALFRTDNGRVWERA